jgi:hypothetical protein
MAVGLKAPARETFGEALDAVGLDRLGAVQRGPPARQVHPFHLLVFDLSGAQAVGEMRRRRNRRFVARQGAQPDGRPGQESIRPHVGHGAGVIHAQIHATYQAHVVIERQPADAAVIDLILAAVHQTLLHHGQIGQQIGVRHHNGLRLDRGARRELQERGLLRIHVHRLPASATRL